MREPEYPEMEDKLYKWFQLQRERHATITTNILREKAAQIHSECYRNKTFTASRGWVDRFKNRRGMRHLKVVGEKLSSDSSAVRPFLRKFSEKMNELNILPSQIYNADESALFWKLLPDRTLVLTGEKAAPGRKTSKERVTFLACANGNGTHKLKMMVIGKAKNPRAFKNCIDLPVEYYSTKKAWMTSSLFVTWFHESFVKQVKKFQLENNLNGKAILLIDNAPSHASETQLISDDGKIITMFLPPNCTPLIQPMDQNAIRITKLHYRKSLLVHVLSLDENDISKAIKNLTIKDAAFLLASSWNKLSPDIIAKCWKNILCYSVDNDSATGTENSESEEDSDDNLSLSVLKQKWISEHENAQELTEIGVMLQTINTDNHQPSQSEINTWLVGDDDRLPLYTDDSSSDEEVMNDEQKVKHEDAIKNFSTCIKWAEENKVELDSLTILRTLRQRAMEAKQKCIRQTMVSEFFK